MKKLFALAAIAAAAVTFQVQAEEMKAPAVEMKAEAMEMKADAKAMKAEGMEMKAEAKEMKADAKDMKADAKEMKAEATMAKKVELKDGTKVEVKGEEAFVIGKDGKAMPAPDGTHTAKDGSTLTTKGGKIVQ